MEKHNNIKLKETTYQILRKHKLIIDANRSIPKPLTWDDYLIYIKTKAEKKVS